MSVSINNSGNSIALRRAALLLTSALTAVSATYGVAYAAPVVIAASDTTTNVNTAIDTAITPAGPTKRDVDFTVAAVAEVTVLPLGVPDVVLNAALNSGDGTILFTNLGKIGTIDALGAITNDVGVNLNGLQAAGATNTLLATNSGLITGGFSAENFGGTASFTNTGTLIGGIVVKAFGDVAVTTGAVTDGVLAQSLATGTGATVGAVTTTVNTSGKVNIIANGDITDNISGAALNDVTIAVSAKAVDVTANATGTIKTVSTALVPNLPSAVNVTAHLDTDIGGGVSAVTIAATGDVRDVLATGAASSTVTIAGKSTGNVTAKVNASESKNYETETNDALLFKTADSTATSKIDTGGVAAVTVAAGGSVDLNVEAAGRTAGTVVIDGAVKGGVSSYARGQADTDTETNAFNPVNGFQTAHNSSEIDAVNGGAATVAVSATGSIGLGVTLEADNGVTLTNAGQIKGNVSLDTEETARTRTETGVYTNANATDNTVSDTVVRERTSVGGVAAVTNGATALIDGSVSANGIGGVTIANAGVVRGTTSATSEGRAFKSTQVNTSAKTVVAGVLPAPTVTTDLTGETFDSTRVANGGDVTGTYSGTNGTLNFTPSADGSVNQLANKASTATVSGTVYGDVNSTAGTGRNETNHNTESTKRVLGSDNVGTYRLDRTRVETAASTLGGVSTVNVTGKVAVGNGSSNASIESSGTDASAVTLTNGLVEGSVDSVAGGYASTETYTKSVDQVYLATSGGTPITTNYARTIVGSRTELGGAASLNLAGTSKILGNATVTGVSSAVANVAVGSSIGKPFPSVNTLTVTAGGTDTTSNEVRSYSRDVVTGAASKIQTTTNTITSAALSGNATATVAGTVIGSVKVGASRGNASAVITGQVTDKLDVATLGGTITFVNRTERTGIVNSTSSGTNFSSLTGPSDVVIETQSFTLANSGGRADATIDTSAALKAAGVNGVVNDINVKGFAGAGVTIAAGSIVGGQVYANSLYNDGSYTQVGTTTAGKLNQTTTFNSTAVGNAATIVNAGTISSATATGLTNATVTNTGKVLGSVEAYSLATNLAVSLVHTDVGNGPIEKEVYTATATAVGGDASVTNAAGSVIKGSVFVAGKTGTVVNNGAIHNTTYLGTSVLDLSAVYTKTASSSVLELTQPTTLFKQTYKFDQNGTSGGINVSGANHTFKEFFTEEENVVRRTSDIVATINLNNNSATLGDIRAEQDDTGAFQTNTTVNLTGAGFLGYARPAGSTGLLLDKAPGVLHSPVLTLSKDAQAAGFVVDPDGVGVRVLGVTALNKTGAGTFVITGSKYIEPTSVGVLPIWTLDVGAFNISGGEIQLGLETGYGEDLGGDKLAKSSLAVAPVPIFGIKGDINNSATLVLGTRVPTAPQKFGNTLVNSGVETIAGLNIVQTGNYNQTDKGITVVGIKASLVRDGSLSINPGTNTNEPLGPITGGVSVPYFTTPLNGGVNQTTSHVAITGNLNLAGKVVFDVSRDSIFSNGDGYELFSYTGTGKVTATADASLPSSFVKFALKQDAVAKTVTLAATRVSYTTGATNPNAVAAAAALDSAIPVIVGQITTDSIGGAGFGTVGALGRAQDIANIVSGLDWRLSGAQAAAVFNELSSAEIYASTSAIDQNAVFNDAVDHLTSRRAYGQDLHSGIWATPAGNFATFNAANSGASRLRVASYGGALGFDFAYANNGAAGFGVGYGQHDLNSRTEEDGRVKTFTIGAYVTQGFGPFYVNGRAAYGASKFNIERRLEILARTISGDYKGHQFDASLEVGYDWKPSDSLVLSPFGKLAVRDWATNGFNEVGGAGIGLKVNSASKSVFLPTVGVKLSGIVGELGALVVQPYTKLSYTFQGDIGNKRTVQYLGGGNSFVLGGVDPDNYGKAEFGLDGSVNDKAGVFLSGAYGFGGGQKVASIRGGVHFNF